MQERACATGLLGGAAYKLHHGERWLCQGHGLSLQSAMLTHLITRRWDDLLQAACAANGFPTESRLAAAQVESVFVTGGLRRAIVMQPPCGRWIILVRPPP